MRRVLILVLVLVACALVLGTYGCQTPTDQGVTSPVPPADTPTSEPTTNPSPTPAVSPSPTTAHSAIPVIGEQAPDFTLPSVWGDMVTLSSYQGQKNVVLLFYRTGG